MSVVCWLLVNKEVVNVVHICRSVPVILLQVGVLHTQTVFIVRFALRLDFLIDLQAGVLHT